MAVSLHHRRLILSEPGVYKLVSTSRKPEAKRFDRWVRRFSIFGCFLLSPAAMPGLGTGGTWDKTCPSAWSYSVYGWDKLVACLPDPMPGVRSESGYFRSLSRRCGDGTEGEVDGGDRRLLA